MWTEARALRDSLRLRLALAFALGGMAALVAVSGFTFWTFQREILARDRRLLAGRIQEVAAVLRQGSRAGLEDEVLGQGAASTDPQVWLRVVAEGAVAIESRGMAATLPPPWFGEEPRGSRLGRDYLLEQRTEGVWRIQGAMDVTEDDRLIAVFRRRLLYVLALGSGGCAIFGWWAATSGLRPIRRIEASTRNITAHRLRERLVAADVPQELRDLVGALNAMLDRLELAFARLSRFSADLAHELRTPITNLTGEAEVALSGERSAQDYRQVVESSLEEFRRLSRLITRMLFLARAEDPGTAIRPGPVPSRQLLEEVLAFFEASAAEQGVALEGQAEGQLRGDADLLRQALANLVGNALQATLRGGAIRVTVGPGIQVTDTGRGIPAEELQGICDRFVRTRASLEGKAEGTGLGLAIVHSIARLHGGSLAIESEPGRGTTVRLHLPG